MNHHPHLAHCELCRSLLRDLQTIADAAKMMFPAVEPSDDLWNRLDEAIKKETPAYGTPVPVEHRLAADAKESAEPAVGEPDAAPAPVQEPGGSN